jgi:adenylate cyclase
VALLDQIVTEFDRLAAAHGVEKIKTTGDGYMAVAGVSRPQDDHLVRLARMALRLPDLVERLSATHGVNLKIRVGLASGPVMAGVIGADKFSYDVWGETVNLASWLDRTGCRARFRSRIRSRGRSATASSVCRADRSR